MSIEEELFKKTKPDFNKIIAYGFKQDNEEYKYSYHIMNNTFKVDITINKEGRVKGKIYDIAFNDEYTNFRLKDITGSFGIKVKNEFIKLLTDIKKHCFIEEPFKSTQTNKIVKYIQEKYQDKPEFEWEKFPGFATFKNKDTKKWYALIMNISKNKIEGDTLEEIEILNLKLNPLEIEKLLKQKGFYPAYHMNKKHWLTTILDSSIPDETIFPLIDESYSYAKKKK